ncbi:MAG: hypothetical protein K2M14_00060 [Muribaculaceae bacterium]|nr:hypothetical protein [Bacteroidales bacterium]MDE6242381.1 hypothetical protein [Muribaculaceae bacterium]
MADEMLGYDEDKAVDFIRQFLPADIRDKYTDDEILFVVDCIWDYYESKGLLELSSDLDEEEEIDVADLTAYVKKALKKDGEIVMDDADLEYVVKGELAYEETLDVFGD